MSKVKSRGMTPYVVSRMCAEYETASPDLSPEREARVSRCPEILGARETKTEEQVAGVIHK